MDPRRFRPGRHRGALPVLLLAVALPLAAREPDPEDLEAVIKGYGRPGFVEPRLASGSRSLRLERMEITLDEGLFHPIRSGQRFMGFAAQGAGTYRYAPRDRAEAARIRRVLNEQEARDFDRDGALQGRLNRVVVVTSLDLFGARETAAGADAVPGDAEIDKKWRQVDPETLLDLIRGRGFEQVLAVARLNGTAYSNVYIEGPSVRVRYVWDRTYGFSDRLWFEGLNPKKQSTWFLDLTPDPWTDAGAPRVARLQELSLDVQIRDKGAAAITADEVLAIERDRVRVLPFALGDTATVRGVKDDSGRDLPFARADQQILVDLQEPRQKGTIVRLRFETDDEPVHDGGIVALGFENFFIPIPQAASLGSFTSTIKVKSPKPLRPVVPGGLIALRDDGKWFELESRNSVPKMWVPILAADYTTEQQSFGGVTVRAHLLGGRRVKEIEETTNLAGRMLEELQRMLGPYPYESLEIVEMPRQGLIAGEALPGMVCLMPRAFKPGTLVDVSGPRALWPQRVMAHEIAHQWFGVDTFGRGPDREAWLSQSFAEYMSGTAIETLSPEEREEEGFPDIRCEWKNGTFPGNRKFKAALVEEGGAGPLDVITVSRGPMVIHMLRGLAGDERFFRIVRRFLKEAGERGATTARLQAISEEELGTGMGWFFDQWVREGGVPKVQFTRHLETLAGGRTVLSGTVRQPAGPGFKRLRIPVALELPGGGRRTVFVVQDQPVTGFRFELDGKPESVRFDPECDTLARYRSE